MKMKPESQQKLYAALDRVLYQVSQEQLAVHIAAIKPVAKNPVVRLAWDFLHASRVRIEYNARFYNDEPDQIDCDGLVDRHVETVLKHWLVSRGITI